MSSELGDPDTILPNYVVTVSSTQWACNTVSPSGIGLKEGSGHKAGVPTLRQTTCKVLGQLPPSVTQFPHF